MSEPPEVSFPTRVDRWVVVLLGLVLGASGVAVVAEMDANPADGWLGLGILGASIVVILVLCLPTRYTVTRDELVIRSGVLRSRIPLDEIQRVYPTRNPLSAPAWSLDRLGVRHGKGRVGSLALISPARREEFLRILAERAGLRRRGEELVRVDQG